jgi:predicted nucleotidyltransferase
MKSTKPDFSVYGFPYQDNLIMAFIGGSEAHGAKIGATDDTDWYGVFLETPEKMIGLDREEFFVFTTGGKVGGNGPDDVDVCLYSLRKWAGMAVKGNPSALHFAFAKEAYRTKWWDRVADHATLFASKRHLKPFTKFADNQLERLCGRKGQLAIHRTELVEKHGYDTKYAMHTIRLYLEAKEYMETGRITLPNPRVGLLIDIRKGKYKLREIEEMGKQFEAEAIDAQAKSHLPASIDVEAVSRLISEIYLDFWNAVKTRSRI